MEILHCSQCHMQYDKTLHTPHMLPKCGHSLCLQCIQDSCKIICPEDGNVQPSDLSLYPINQTILRLVSKNLTNDIICSLHQKKLDLVCLDDQCKICTNCALFGHHKQHNIQQLDEVIRSIDQNFQEIQKLNSSLQYKLKTMTQNTITEQIHDQIYQCIKQQQQLAQEQFQDIINQILLKQQKVMQEIEFKYQQLEQDFISQQSNIIQQIRNKADQWIFNSNDLIQEYIQNKNKKDITYDLYQDNNILEGTEIIQQIEDYQLKLSLNLQDLLNNIPNELQDASLEQSFNTDEKQPLANSSLPDSTCQSQGSTNTISPQLKRCSVSHTLVSPKLPSRLSSASPKKPQKKKLNLKIESMILNCNGDYLDLSQQDLGDDGIILLEEYIRNKKIKLLKLTRNHISDQGAIKLIELYCQVLYLQSNIITEKFIDLLINAIQKQIQIHIKTIYLNQNLINSFRVKKKIEDLKKFGITIQL